MMNSHLRPALVILSIGILDIYLAGCSEEPATVGPADSGSVADSKADGISGGADAKTDSGDSGIATSIKACPGQKFPETPDDPGQPGPFAVGQKTVDLAGFVTEVWYPAPKASAIGKPKVRYDLRKQLPPEDATKISDANNPWQECDCVADLPVDASYGPYPLVVFIHGTAGFRTQSLTQMTHWVSRGFIVISADHPGIGLADILKFKFAGKQKEDATKMLDALASKPSSFSFLADRIDLTNLGMAGHSAGGGAVSTFGDRAKVLLPLAAGGTTAGKSLAATLVMGGIEDGVVAYSRQQDGFATSPKRKRLVGIGKAGHLAFSDLCYIGRDKGGLLKIATEAGVEVPEIVAKLARDGCNEGQLPAEDGWKIVNYATTAALEETLRCSSSAAAAFTKIKSSFGAVAEYVEQL